MSAAGDTYKVLVAWYTCIHGKLRNTYLWDIGDEL